jgi:transposase
MSEGAIMHEAYGLPNDHRLTVLAYAQVHGIAAAIERFNVGKSSIYRWRQRLTAPPRAATKETS